MMKNFFRMNAPYHDFAIVQFKAEKKFSCNEMLCKQVGKKTYVLSFEDIVVEEGEFGFSGFSGYVADSHDFYYGEVPHAFDNIRTGKYSIFSIKDDVVKILVDTFGQGVIYYAETNSFVIASNRLHLASILMRKMGESLSLNLPVVARKFFYNIYNENSYQNQIDATLVKEIKKLPVGKSLRVSNGRVELSEEALYHLVSREKQLSSRFYEQFLHDGVTELRSTLVNISKGKYFSEIVVPISGGKDSRVILSALMSSDIDCSKIYGRTYKTKSILDDKIAIKIQRDLKINNYKNKSALGWYKTKIKIDDFLKIYTSFFAGGYTLLNAGGESSIGANHSAINLVGTSSNVLRCGAAGTLLKFFPVERMSTSAFIKNFHDKFGLKKVFGDDIEKLAYDDLERFYEDVPGECLADKLEYSHMNVGSRFHGGQASIFHGWNDSPFLNVMLTPSLYKAAKALPVGERIEGRVFFDFVVKAMPSLATYPYDKLFPYAEMMYQKLGINIVNVDEKYDVSSYYQKDRDLSLSFLPAMNGRFTNGQILSYLEDVSEGLISEIVDLIPDLGFLKSQRFRRYIKISFQKDGEYAKRAVLTLIAVKTLLFD